MKQQSPAEDTQELLIRIRGTVQGVGFRPFIARLADHFNVSGWVRNDERGVTIQAGQKRATLHSFIEAIRHESPPAARIDELLMEESGEGSGLKKPGTFEIIESDVATESPTASVTPDLAICPDCREELLDPDNRRYNYPFINCTNCGPRYSIIESLPYDRERTTMSVFEMCPDCEKEYLDPLDRRFHAQPNACPKCGPSLCLKNMEGKTLAIKEDALIEACEALDAGKIVAVKGLGGFHLLVDAVAETAVSCLRRRKHRDEKPFAVMFSSLEELRKESEVSLEEAELLTSSAAPIVLVKQRQSSGLAKSIAPGNPWIGAILPYTPLHVLLMEQFRGPLVATSANLSEEPLCSGNEESITRLRGIADLVLSHERKIARPVDDSVQRVTSHGPLLLRRARGYAPSPVPLPDGLQCNEPILSLGAHLKNTVAICMDRQIVLSPHIGDLSNGRAVTAFKNTIELLLGLYGRTTDVVTCDLHPDYISTQIAESMGIPIIHVQHHLAHILACLLEHDGGPEKVLGVSWDGTGYGEDGTIWGGEFILIDRSKGTARRVAHLKPFQLPGGEGAIRQTGRSALGVLHAGGLLDHIPCSNVIETAFLGTSRDRQILLKALEKGINAPVTTSAGRLFDAVAALLDLARHNSFEGQAGMALEFAAQKAKAESKPLSWSLGDSTHQEGALEVNWSPMIAELCELKQGGEDPCRLSMRFHMTLADMVLEISKAVGVRTVALTGGCFQNAVLSDLTTRALSNSGHTVLLHKNLSPNDNSIAGGQALAALWNLSRVQT